MAEQNQILIGAIRKLALAGEQAGFSVEEMIELLKTDASVETLLLPEVQESPSGASLRLR